MKNSKEDPKGIRCTFSLDEDLEKLLREIQAKKIRQSSNSVSFSSVVNEILRKSLK